MGIFIFAENNLFMQFCQPFGYYKRFASHEVKVGNIYIGANNPIHIQSMTNTPTDNVKATLLQCKELIDAGSELVRITARNSADVGAISLIRNKLTKDGYSNPLVADVHFSPKVALEAAKIVEKVRINPGNYTDISKTSAKKAFTDTDYKNEVEKAHEAILPLINTCKRYGTALRLGVNHGSLAWRIVEKYGNTPRGMVASAMEFLEIFCAENFNQVIISMKASNPFTMVYATRLLTQTMYEHGMTFPIHVGVTEAGFGDEGIFRSAVGTGTLLLDGIGDTIRVSLSGNPVKEIPVAKNLITECQKFIQRERENEQMEWPYDPFSSQNFHILYPSWPAQTPIPATLSESPNADILIKDNEIILGNKKVSITEHLVKVEITNTSNSHNLRRKITSQGKDKGLCVIAHDTNKNSLRSAIISGYLLCDRLICGCLTEPAETETMNEIFRSSGLRNDNATYISCPTCGRTTYELEELAMQVKEKTKHLKHIKIAIMGCIVNGPGEMDDADYGILGEGGDLVSIYRRNEAVRKKVESHSAAELLLEIILQDRKINT